MSRKVSDIFFGLWNLPSHYIKDTVIAFKRVIHVFKYGYPPQATWETFQWFTCVMRDILREYGDCHYGYPSRFSSPEEWNKEINKAINLLNKMDDNNPAYEDISLYEQSDAQVAAKDAFFDWFKENFFDLWD